MGKEEKLKLKLVKLRDRLVVENEKENAVLRNRGFGYAQRHVKIGFSTRKTDDLKQRIKILEFELSELEPQCTCIAEFGDDENCPHCYPVTIIQ